MADEHTFTLIFEASGEVTPAPRDDHTAETEPEPEPEEAEQ